MELEEVNATPLLTGTTRGNVPQLSTIGRARGFVLENCLKYRLYLSCRESQRPTRDAECHLPLNANV